MIDIKILKSAYKDLSAGKSFYDSQDFGVGDYFLDSLISDIDSLQVYAGIHKQVYGHYKLNSKRFPYAIYYKMTGNAVVVRRVLDMRSNPKTMVSKLR